MNTPHRSSRVGSLRFTLVLALLALCALSALPAQAQVIVSARPGPAGSVLLHLGDSWGNSDLPRLDRVEVEGQVIEVHLVSLNGNGATASFPWRVDLEVDGLARDEYRVEVYYRSVPEEEEPGMLLDTADVTVVPRACQGGLSDEISLVHCLQRGRFAVRAWFKVEESDEEAPARIHPMTEDSGGFWFFNPDNVEVMVKVLDGCEAFDRFWVFAAGLTNVGVRIEVTDSWTGETWDHQSAVGEGFDEIRDTDAFATCDAPDPA